MQDLVEQKHNDPLQTTFSLQNTLSNCKDKERKRKSNYQGLAKKGKASKGLLNKSRGNGPSKGATELGEVYNRSRNLNAEKRFEKAKPVIDINSHDTLTSILAVPKSSFTSSQDELELPCEWNECFEEFNDLTEFMGHVSEHIMEVPITEGQKGLLHGNQNMQKQIRQRRRGRNAELSLQDVDVIDDDEEEEERLLEEAGLEESMQYVDERFFCCLWRGCGYITPANDEIIRHINFHTFHTKLKSHGASICKETGIEPCTIGTHQRNVIPELSDPLLSAMQHANKI
jgi:hypothetical protein